MRESPCLIEKDPYLLELAKRRKEKGTTEESKEKKTRSGNRTID